MSQAALACESCAALRESNERLRGQLDALAVDLQNLQTDLVAKNRQLAAAKREIERVMKEQVSDAEVEDVWTAYLGNVWSGKGRKPILDDARRKLIRLRRKEGYEPERLKKAIVALGKFPNTLSGRGRVPAGTPGSTRYADLDHAIGGQQPGKRIDALIAKLEQANTVPAPEPRRRRVEVRCALDLADQLEQTHGLEVKDLGHGRWMSQCPAHPDKTPSLSIREAADGAILLHCFGGCLTEDVLTSIGWEFGHLRGGDPRATTSAREAEYAGRLA